MAVEIYNPYNLHAKLPKPLLGVIPPKSSIVVPGTKADLDRIVESWTVPQGVLFPSRVIRGNIRVVVLDTRPWVTFDVKELVNFDPEVHCRKCGTLHVPGTKRCSLCVDGDLVEYYSGGTHASAVRSLPSVVPSG